MSDKQSSLMPKNEDVDLFAEDAPRYTVADYSRFTHLSAATIYRNLSDIPHMRVGRRLVMFSRRQVREALASMERGGKVAA